ncbi:hypothetical protein DPMN_004507 [Dreissena polymorpha]|uniref:Uncharacterized protein n=1 Tax=Dreissena polymorpha TaxID=45954 RepID=A0A9D4RVN6_DREPO|nr:hypothetical protein DPMN_004507 [Dreissena polymorpha]
MTLTSWVAPALNFKITPKFSVKEQEHTRWRSAREKSKIMVNSTTNTSANITMNGEKLEEVTSFKYLGASLPKDITRTADVRISIVMATAAMA